MERLKACQFVDPSVLKIKLSFEICTSRDVRKVKVQEEIVRLVVQRFGSQLIYSENGIKSVIRSWVKITVFDLGKRFPFASTFVDENYLIMLENKILSIGKRWEKIIPK